MLNKLTLIQYKHTSFDFYYHMSFQTQLHKPFT